MLLWEGRFSVAKRSIVVSRVFLERVGLVFMAFKT